MTWPVPVAGAIASQAASVYESTPALEGIDARSENSLAGASTKITEEAILDLYLFQANLAQELMPDTAQAYLSRHASIWGVPRLQPTGSRGNGSVTVTGPVVVPTGFTFTAPSGVIISTTAATSCPAAGTFTVPLAGSASDGSASNLAAGVVLQVVSPLAGLSPQAAIVAAASDGSGLSGGTDLEAIESWRARILARIRLPAMGGSNADYTTWSKEALDTVAYVQVISNWTGLGNVGVFIAMAGPRAPTTAEIAIVQAYLNIAKPVTAAVFVLAATLVPTNFTLHLNPDTLAIRAAVTAALSLSFQTDAQIGATLYYSRFDAAISSVGGEYSFERTVPAGDVVPASTQLLTLGTITWV
jgi:uncharacterized phage protein gp47/JayE